MLRSAPIQAPIHKSQGMTRFAALFAGLLITVAAGAAADAQVRLVRTGPDSLGADWRQQQDEARDGVRHGNLLPLSTVIAQIRKRTPGRPLDAGSEFMGERPVYRVRWITDNGRRIDYIIDAATGAVLSGG
jgi:uncharacterized membrane protein YkoI